MVSRGDGFGVRPRALEDLSGRVLAGADEVGDLAQVGAGVACVVTGCGELDTELARYQGAWSYAVSAVADASVATGLELTQAAEDYRSVDAAAFPDGGPR